MFSSHWKIHLLDKAVSKIINKYLLVTVRKNLIFLINSKLYYSSFISWELPDWSHSKTPISIDWNYTSTHRRPYTRHTYGGEYKYSILYIDNLIRLKLRREKYGIVRDLSEYIYMFTSFFYDYNYVPGFLLRKSKRKKILIFILLMDYFIIEMFYKVLVSTKFVLHEMVQKMDDSTLALFGMTTKDNFRTMFSPWYDRGRINYSHKLASWKNYNINFSLFKKNTYARHYIPPRKFFYKDFAWGPNEVKV